MAIITRIFLALTIVCSLGAIYLGMVKKGERVKLQADLLATQTDLQNKKDENSKLSKDIDAKKGEIKVAEQKVSTATSEAESAKKELESQRSQVAEVRSKLAKVEAELSAKQAEIQKITDLLPKDMTPDQVGAKLKELGEQMVSLDQEKKILVDKLSKQEADIKKLEEEKKKRANGQMPAGLTGHILAVNPDWNFVVLDIGANQGVVEEANMIVYREGALVGKIKITSVEPSISIGDILPEWEKSKVQEGDSVVY